MRSNEKIYSHEKIQFNLVRFQKFGKTFEIVVDPDLAIAYKSKNKDSVEDLSELLKAEKVFSDAKKGEIATDEDLEKVFLTTDFFKVALKIIKQGDIQLSSEYREKLRDDKRKLIIHNVHRMAIDPRSGLPHPVSRIEAAMTEAKVKIDEFKKAEDQVQEVISKLKPIIPIRVEEKVIQVKLPMQFAAKLHGFIKTQGKLESEDWLSDGSFVCKLRIPAGIYGELTEELGSRTRGSAEINVLNK